MLARLLLLRVIAGAAFLCVIPGAAIAATARDPVPPTFRLPDIATPERYDWHVAIDPRADEFDGIVTIDIRFKRASAELWLNATALEIGAASVEQGDRALDVALVRGGEDFVGLRGRFDAGPARVRIAYRGKVDAVAVEGVFRQRERGEWYVLTQFQAIGARRALPCFDEPAWKAPWRITIDAPASELAVSNGPQVSATAIAGRPGWWRHEFAETRPMPTYLVALAVGPFDVVEGGVAGRGRTALRYLAPKGRGAEARYAASITPRLLEALEDYFGTPYPFEKLDSIAIPHLVTFAAMENPGLVTYGSQWMLAREHEETERFRETHASIAAHEIAHMWFGNLVTLAWWDDTWLNEAFASWLASKTVHAMHPSWDNGVYRSQTRHSALRADRLAAARRIANPVESRNAIDDAFDDITYDKGEEVLSMFEAYFGPERFQAGVRAFLARHAWGTATSADFFRALGEASGSPASAIAALSAFVNQPGAPLVDVGLDCANPASLSVSQRRFRPVGSRAPELEWSTPACFRTNDGTFCALIDATTRRVDIPGGQCPRWIVGNARGAGHYLVRYEAGLLRRIAARAASLPGREAQAWVKDTLLLADAGLVPTDSALVVAEAAFLHPSPNVRLAGVHLLEGLRDDRLSGAQRHEKDRVVAARVVPLARELGWDVRRDDPGEVRELRARLMPFAADREAGRGLRAGARARALRWIADRKSVEATVAPAVLAVAGRFADGATFERLARAASAAENSRERNMLLAALARVRDPALRSRALALPLDGRSTYTLLNQMLQDDENRPAAFDHVLRNLPALEAKLPRDTPAALLAPLSRLCTPAQRAALAEAFGERVSSWMTGPLRYAQALESIDLCIAAQSITAGASGTTVTPGAAQAATTRGPGSITSPPPRTPASARAASPPR